MHVIPLPAMTDNYIWLVHDDAGNAIVVDPGESEVVEQALAARHLQLRAILLTHHHPDHVGGAESLRRRHGVAVFAPFDDRINAATDSVREGDVIELDSPAIRFDVLEIPGHTLSHVAYVGGGLLLCGDTLFSLGCGRLFEGTPSQMLASLDRLAALPEATLVCAGHEYTQANGRFALTVDPDNAPLRARVQEVAMLRSRSLPSLPVQLGVELACNPFLRVDAIAIAHWCKQHHDVGNDRVARFAVLRDSKNHFPG